MDVRLSPEQHALRDSVAKVVSDRAAKAVGELDDEGRAAKLEVAVAGAGWRELRADDGAGAPLASAVEAAIVAEELSRGAADVAFLGPTLAAELRRRAGLGDAAAPETVTLSTDLAALAEAGSPALALDAAGATRALVLDSGALASVVLSDTEVRTDLTRRTATVDTDAALILPDQSRGLSGDDITTVTALGLALTTAELVGSMRGAATLATDYAKDRKQYGNAIGTFQAVQHLLADAHVATEGSRSMALHAAWAVDALPPADALAAAAAAKAYASRAARTVCEIAIQVHGGIGNTWECLAHVHLRRALLSIDVFGGTGPNLQRVLEHQGIGAHRGLR
jgi:alkylation response protein AidB-like acyl-CoA dehydrogenase